MNNSRVYRAGTTIIRVEPVTDIEILRLLKNKKKIFEKLKKQMRKKL